MCAKTQSTLEIRLPCLTAASRRVNMSMSQHKVFLFQLHSFLNELINSEKVLITFTLGTLAQPPFIWFPTFFQTVFLKIRVQVGQSNMLLQQLKLHVMGFISHGLSCIKGRHPVKPIINTVGWANPEGDSSCPKMPKIGEMIDFTFGRSPFGNVKVIKVAA